LQPLLEVDVGPGASLAAGKRRLLVRLCLFAFCGGLLLLLSSRPADAAERREPRLLDPVGTTLKATAREVDSFAGRAAGSGTSTVAKATSAARQVAPPHPRPATSAARRAATATVKRGAPAVTSPVCRPAPSTRPATSTPRTAARSTGTTAKPKAAGKSVALVAKTAGGPVARVTEGRLYTPVDNLGTLTRRCARLPLRGAEPGAGSLKSALGPVAELTGPVLRPLGPALAPVGSALAPVGSALAPRCAGAGRVRACSGHRSGGWAAAGAGGGWVGDPGAGRVSGP
jgi:hypothetical protein